MWNVPELREVESEKMSGPKAAARTAGCRRQIRSGEDAKNDDVKSR